MRRLNRYASEPTTAPSTGQYHVPVAFVGKTGCAAATVPRKLKLIWAGSGTPPLSSALVLRIK
jgi:hypothetical protein